MAINKLPETRVRTAKPKEKQYRLTDGGGLSLLVKTNGSRLWRFDYTYRQKRKTISLGAYPDVTLSHARSLALEARQHVSNGIDPSDLRKTEKQLISDENIQKQRLADGLPMEGSFEEVAREWGALNVNNWDEKNERTKRLLERNIFPAIGHISIADITPAQLRDALLGMTGVLESAHRTYRICGRIFRYGVVNGKCSQDITLVLQGLLPTAEVKHFSAITDPKQVRLLLQAIDGYEGSFIVKCALQLAPLVFVRPGELRAAEWKDIDGNEWRYLVTKTRTEHIVPLSRQSVEILAYIHRLTGTGRYVFPSMRTPDGSRCISENTLNGALRRLGYSKDDMTAHGFRAMARTILDEVLKVRPDFIEHQLAHTVRDVNGRAYNRTSFLPERKQMMQQWADYLDSLKGE